MRFGFRALILLVFNNFVFGLTSECKEYDFGTITEGNSVAYSFKVKNNSEESATIKQILVECACISTLTKEFILKPHEQKDIAITFNSWGYGGREVKKEIVLVEGSGTQFILVLKGKVAGLPPEERLNIMPLGMTIWNTENEKHEIVIQAPASKNATIKINAPDWIEYTLAEKKSFYSRFRSYVLEFSLKRKSDIPLYGDIEILTNLPRFGKVPIRIKVDPVPEVIVSPPILFFSESGNLSKDIEIKILRKNKVDESNSLNDYSIQSFPASNIKITLLDCKENILKYHVDVADCNELPSQLLILKGKIGIKKVPIVKN